LIGVTDARGNSVSYSLDSTGNRTGEQISDPTGTLQRSITRSFDALNRMQQVSGAAN
jgi:YD repeat-containing protein